MTTEIKIPDALDDVRISVFENATSTKPRTSASIHELLSLIKTPPDILLKQIESLRQHLMKGDEEKYKHGKKSLLLSQFQEHFPDVRLKVWLTTLVFYRLTLIRLKTLPCYETK